MGADTKIQWCHHTFNPWWGCQRVSRGCEHCYAETFDRRVSGKTAAHWGPTSARRFFGETHWRGPLNWNAAAMRAGERRRVFCASMADVFEERPELESERVKLFALIDATPALDWLLLTKRPENIARLMPAPAVGRRVALFGGDLVRPNVWLGTTVEDQQRANERIPELIKVPAVVRFLSCEPLLEAVDLSRWLDEDQTGFVGYIDWVIIGGESGHGARMFDMGWARSLVAQCRDGGRAEAAPFVKQLGANPHGEWGDNPPMHHLTDITVNPPRESMELDRFKNGRWRLRDGHGGDPAEWPKDLRVREFPEVRR